MPTRDDMIDDLRSAAFVAGVAISTMECEAALNGANGDYNQALLALGLPSGVAAAPSYTGTKPTAAYASVATSEPPPPYPGTKPTAPLLSPKAATSDSAVWGQQLKTTGSGSSAPPPRPMLQRGNSYRERGMQRSSSQFFAPKDQWYQGGHDAALRNGFLRKVYGIVFFQVLLTAGVSYGTLRASAPAAAGCDSGAVCPPQACSPRPLRARRSPGRSGARPSWSRTPAPTRAPTRATASATTAARAT